MTVSLTRNHIESLCTATQTTVDPATVVKTSPSLCHSTGEKCVKFRPLVKRRGSVLLAQLSVVTDKYLSPRGSQLSPARPYLTQTRQYVSGVKREQHRPRKQGEKKSWCVCSRLDCNETPPHWAVWLFLDSTRTSALPPPPPHKTLATYLHL